MSNEPYTGIVTQLCPCFNMMLKSRAMKKYKYTKTFRHNGRRYYVRGDTLQEVYEKKAERLHALRNGAETVNSNMTFEAWARIAVDTYKASAKEDTRRAILYRLNSCAFPDIGAVAISKIKPIQLQRVMNKQSGMSKSHVQKLRSDLRFVFQKAVENKMILSNPAASLQIPSCQDNRRRSITDSEREHLLSVCDTDIRFNVFLLMLYCGCRPSEAWRAVGADIQKIDGVNVLHVRGTKSKTSDRYVPIPDALYSRISGTPHDVPIAPTLTGTMMSKTDYVRYTLQLLLWI